MFSIFERQPIYYKRCCEALFALKGCRNEVLNQKRIMCLSALTKRTLSSVTTTKIELNTSLIGSTDSSEPVDKMEKIDKAMQAYLQKAKEHDLFMKKRSEEFEMGKRHLCNIMGWDSSHITQKDIDSAIEYLLPSGLFDLNARPVMKPPEEIYQKRKEAEFDVQGRPHHTMFYTRKPNYYKLLHDLFEEYLKLNKFEDEMIRNGVIVPSPESKASILNSEWLSHKEIKEMMLERVTEDDYNYLISVMEKVANHPYSSVAKDFLLNYRKELVSVTSTMEIPPLMYTEDGRQYMTANGRKKNSEATVTVWGNGTGKFTVDGHDLLYFDHFKDREQVMFPLQFTEMLMKVDVEATITRGGERKQLASQAAAIRYALSMALRSFVDTEVVEEMRLSGLLTKDHRTKERKHVAHRGARKRFAYRKR